MRETLRKFLFAWFIAVITAVAGFCAEETPALVVAVQVKGTVEVQHAAATSREPVTDGRHLVATDVVTTAKASSVVLVLENGAFVSLRENSRLKITTALQAPLAEGAPVAKGSEPREPGTSHSRFELEFGEMLARVRKLNPSSTFEVQTPVSVAAVRGTVFEVSYRADPTGPAQYRLSTASGMVHVTPRGGELLKVAAAEQVEFAARLRGNRVRIQPFKNSRLNPQQHAQLEKEAQDTERSAADLTKRAQASAAAANPKAPVRVDDKAKDSVNLPREAAKEVVAPDNSKAAATPAVKKKKLPDPPSPPKK